MKKMKLVSETKTLGAFQLGEDKHKGGSKCSTLNSIKLNLVS